MKQFELDLPVYEQGTDFSILLNQYNNDEIRAMTELGRQYSDAATLCHRMALHMRMNSLSVIGSKHSIIVNGSQEILNNLANRGILEIEEI